MRPLHLIPASDDLEWSRYIQIKNGLVTTANRSNFVMLPVEEVFGINVFTHEDEFYISKKEYKDLMSICGRETIFPGDLDFKVSRRNRSYLFSKVPSSEDLEFQLFTKETVKDFPDFKVKNLLFKRGEVLFETGLQREMLEAVAKILECEKLHFHRHTPDDAVPHLLRPVDAMKPGFAGVANLGEDGKPFVPTFIHTQAPQNTHHLSNNGKELSWSTDSQPVHEIMEVVQDLMLGMENHALLAKLKALRMLL